MSNCCTGAFPRNSENDSVTLWYLAPSQRRLLRSGWALCSCRDKWLPQVPWYWDCAFNCCQSCDSQAGPHICSLCCSWSRENWPRSLPQWAWVRTIWWLSWFCIPKSRPLMARGKWQSWKVHEVVWKGTSHHYKLEATNVSVSPHLSVALVFIWEHFFFLS